MRRFTFLMFMALMIFPVNCQSAAFDVDPEPKGNPKPQKIYNMFEYMVPPQKASDAKQFYLEGYMQCLGIPGSDCVKNGEALYSRNGYEKQTVSDPDENGNLRFTTSKARTGLLGHPCEYYVTREGFDEDDQPITFMYVYAEMMDWVDNKKYRAYYDGLGEPMFEMARSRVKNGVAYLQTPSVGTDYFCNGASNTYPLMDTVYVPYFFSFTRDTIDDVNRQMGSMGPVEPKWVDMALAMGQTKAELMVVQGQWGYTGAAPGKEGSRWVYRELYMYLKGVGWVSWRWQEHQDGDLQRDFVTHKLGNLDTIVWEAPGEAIRNVELCETIQ